MVHIPLAADTANPFDFTPAAARPRRDGWTPAVQTAFVAALAGGASVTDACRRVARSPKSAYALRKRADAAGFAAAWDAAVAEIEVFAEGTAIERCLTGTLRPIVYRGRVVGERLVHDDRLLMHLLRRKRPGGAAVPGGAADPYAAYEAALTQLNRNNFADVGEIFA